MKSVIRIAIAATALIAMASPARAQGCGEGDIKLCGTVWNDVDGNGIQDDDTNPDPLVDSSVLSGVDVTLYSFVPDSMGGHWEAGPSTVTGPEGNYIFLDADVPDGTYKVVVNVPAGMEPTLTGQGGDMTMDNDGVSDTLGAAAEVCLGPAPCVPSQEFDFGFHPTGVVSPGTGTPGYWKNHTEVWSGVTIGGVWYSSADASALMGKVSKDKTVSLFSQLVAAKLNVSIGNESSCIDGRIAQADAWLTTHPVGSGVAASSAAWQQIAAAHKDLDDYNNGRLCAPHRN
jgi:hypothetical protein